MTALKYFDVSEKVSSELYTEKKVFKKKTGYVANTLAYILLHACSLGNVPH